MTCILTVFVLPKLCSTIQCAISKICLSAPESQAVPKNVCRHRLLNRDESTGALKDGISWRKTRRACPSSGPEPLVYSRLAGLDYAWTDRQMLLDYGEPFPALFQRCFVEGSSSSQVNRLSIAVARSLSD